MAKGAYVGVNGAARKVKTEYVGVGGAARKVKKSYVGINGAARESFGAEIPLYFRIYVYVDCYSHMGTERSGVWLEFEQESGRHYRSNTVALTPTAGGTAYISDCGAEVEDSSVFDYINSFTLYRKYSSDTQLMKKGNNYTFSGGPTSWFQIDSETEFRGEIDMVTI